MAKENALNNLLIMSQAYDIFGIFVFLQAYDIWHFTYVSPYQTSFEQWGHARVFLDSKNLYWYKIHYFTYLRH